MNTPYFSRRSFLQATAVSGAAVLAGPLINGVLAGESPVALQASVKTVYAVFKCHLDVGFIDSQANIIRRYFDQYFLNAIALARKLREAGGTYRYVWTTGSWLVHEYLRQMPAAQQANMVEAIHNGDLSYHAIPFTWQTEMLDRSLIDGALCMAANLDKRFGRKTTGAKMTDVPGHTRSIIAPLATAGVTFLNIGVNPASTPPRVPKLFRWRDPEGAEIVVMCHGQDYGGEIDLPGADAVVAMNVRGDNSGPHTEAEVKKIFDDLHHRYPNTTILACGLSEIANAISPIREQLPVVEQEIGDTWIHGCASDPIKISRYREICRLRQEWIAQGKVTVGDAADMAMVPWLSLVAEHTWGCDVKSIIGDWKVYKPTELTAAWSKPNIQKAILTWEEKRRNVDTAVATLPEPLQQEAINRLEKLDASQPVTAGMEPFAPGQEITTSNFVLTLDAESGAIRQLTDRKTNRQWAGPDHPLALFSYQSFTSDDYHRYITQYVHISANWAVLDFGKHGIDKYSLQSKRWNPTLIKAWLEKTADATRIVTELAMPQEPPEVDDVVGWPKRMTMEIRLPNDQPVLEIDFQFFQKSANRLPEAMWFTFAPIAPDPKGWMLDKSGRLISPLDVVENGNRQMHAVTKYVTYRDLTGQFIIEILDAPVVAPGKMSLLNFNNDQPDLSQGIHINLFNNTWGTNYVMWYDQDTRYRFRVRTA
jgi:hypothetical protein